MSRRILVIVGHPDPEPKRLCRALARAYIEGAQSIGHQTRLFDIADSNFQMLRTAEEFGHRGVPSELNEVAQDLQWAEHILIIFPLWLGTMPAMLKALLEQLMRPGVAFAYPEKGQVLTRKLLKGRSARIVVTMGMPAAIYRIWYRKHGIAGLRRSILNFVGISPVREMLLGNVEGKSDAARLKWIEQMRQLGLRAS